MKGGRLAGAITLAALASLIGLALVLLTLPRLMAYGDMGEISDVRRALDDGRPVETQRLIEAHRVLETAERWLPDDAGIPFNKARIDRRLASVAAKADGGLAEGAAIWRERAVENLSAAAAAAPANGFVWAMLADARLNAGAEAADVIPELKLARLTGPYLSSALLLSHGVVLRHWEVMPDDLRVHAAGSTHLLWKRQRLWPVLMSTFLDATPEARIAVIDDISEDPNVLEYFYRYLKATVEGN